MTQVLQEPFMVSRNVRKYSMLLLFTSLFLWSIRTSAQTLNIWLGVAPGSENWKQTEQRADNTPLGTVLTDVVTPTITAFLPEKGKATGAGVIVAPGGACIALAIDLEANSVARWLQEKGIAAFVLKYRTQEKKGEGIPADLNEDEACKYGMADGVQALKVVRQHATAWGISPHRIGFMGFSAGAMVASGALLQPDAALRPDFAALIYGGPFGVMPTIPKSLPPTFMAWAQDDEIAGEVVSKFYGALRAAGNKPEVHIYSAGHHGFGMKKQGTTSDHWIDEFYWWLISLGDPK
jgi:acetyl esterase/lipase